MKILIFLIVATAYAAAQQQQYTTPVPILKQINRHNEDGSYSYGYEGADGSFKIESKYPTGEVYGKYGYVDDTGKVREVEYGASRRGFEPSGTGIKVAPPTLNDNNYNAPLNPGDEDDGQYREDPSIYYKDERYNSNVNNNIQPQRPAYKPQQQVYQPQQYQPQPQQYQPQPQQYQPQPQQYQAPHIPQRQSFFDTQPQQYNQQYYQPPAPQRQYYNPAPSTHDQFRGHPATDFDVNSGSYTINYTG